MASFVGGVGSIPKESVALVQKRAAPRNNPPYIVRYSGVRLSLLSKTLKFFLFLIDPTLGSLHWNDGLLFSKQHVVDIDNSKLSYSNPKHFGKLSSFHINISTKRDHVGYLDEAVVPT